MKTRNDMITLLEGVPGAREILSHSLFLSMDRYSHHGSISCLDHTLMVACIALSLARRSGADIQATVRSALLHDFYLYDWHTDSPGLHGFRHPGIALENARLHFELSRVEENAILRHMWPLTPIPPRYREGHIVSIADKAATVRDYGSREKRRNPDRVINSAICPEKS